MNIVKNGTEAVSETDEVSDMGIGIPPEPRPRLGEAFLRVKGARAAHIAGTGPGLSVPKQTIDAHGGHLGIQSEEGTGSAFQVLLPRGGVER